VEPDDVIGGDVQHVEALVVVDAEEGREGQLDEVVAVKSDARDVLEVVVVDVQKDVSISELRVDTCHRCLQALTRTVFT
jgi:hypothetical protein